MEINSLEELGISIVSVTCDKGKLTEIFGRFSGFDRVRKYGYWQNFPNPVFVHSHQSAGIQLADFVTYFTAKVLNYTQERANTPEYDVYRRIHKWRFDFKTSFPQAKPDSAILPTLKYRKLLAAMHAETALLHCGGEQRTLPQCEALVQTLVESIFSVEEN